MRDKPVVAHVHDCFFKRSETFIYNYLVSLRAVQPICISNRSLINLDLFPFPESDLYSLERACYSIPWFMQSIVWKITRRDLRLEKILRVRKVVLIHAHFGPTGWFFLRSKLRTGLPLVTSFYGTDINAFIRKASWREELFTHGDLFLVEGPYMQQRLVEIGCPEEKVHIQRIAIKIREIPWRARRKGGNSSTVVLFAGRFVEKKGLLYALEAVRELKQQGRAIEFRIIGEGPYAPQIWGFIQEHQMGDYTRLLGFMNYQDYLREMYNADIFLQPSVKAADGDTEGGAPTTILEAQAIGLPVVSTHHCDIPNVVIPGESALLVQERNSRALVEALGYLLDHPEQWEKMAWAGRSFVEKYHNVEREVNRLEEKYAMLLQGRVFP